MSHKDSPSPKIVYLGGYAGDGDHPDHRHENAWELLYLLEGCIAERSGDSVFEMKPGSFVVHPPGVRHGDTAEGKYFLYHVLVTSDGPLKWPRSGRDPEGGPIGSLLGMAVDEWYNNFLNRESFLRHAASLLNILMKRCGAQEQGGDNGLAVVTQARGIFRREFRQPIDFKCIAHQLQISRSTLYAHFHKTLGRTPQEELDRIRLQHAVFLLRHSELPIGQIAKGSGFCSSSHLARKLQAAFQTTARHIRDTNGAREPSRD
jgi:AraC-like DNA-binding protein